MTNALPGASWHQWSEAVDCFWLIDGKASWSTRISVGGVNGYRVYAEEASALGLDAGGHWTRLRDWPHAQLRRESSPLGTMTWAEVDLQMRARFPKILERIPEVA